MSYLEQCEREELNRLCDLITWKCCFCSTEENPRYDMHGLEVFETIGDKQVQTGVICRECQNKPVKLEMFL